MLENILNYNSIDVNNLISKDDISKKEPISTSDKSESITNKSESISNKSESISTKSDIQNEEVLI